MAAATQLQERNPDLAPKFMEAVREMKQEVEVIVSRRPGSMPAASSQAGRGSKTVQKKVEDFRLTGIRQRAKSVETSILGVLDQIQWAESQPAMGGDDGVAMREEQLTVAMMEASNATSEAEALRVRHASKPRGGRPLHLECPTPWFCFTVTGPRCQGRGRIFVDPRPGEAFPGSQP